MARAHLLPALHPMQAILARLTDPMHRIAVLIAAVTGLRALRLGNFRLAMAQIGKGYVRQMQTRLKTEGGRKKVPIPQDLAEP
ncbi:hypothetical protein [Granulicella sp. dw_53]|uniref:hypothetical protein n=1 Tax=Granulicella sp. dw_53 TaxID=2719792 RepID=UPI001BD1ED6A|nr:hypothetical protein [Granulicella sp. dw_53]